jgi:hypothetical protein
MIDSMGMFNNPNRWDCVGCVTVRLCQVESGQEVHAPDRVGGVTPTCALWQC